jgi:hypothetical protein
MSGSQTKPAAYARFRRTRIVLLLALLQTCGAVSLIAQSAGREYRIKAVFLFNFAQFAHWPPAAFADDQSPLVIGVLGADPFGPMLAEVVAGEKLGRHAFVVRHYDRVEEVGACQILFISRSASGRLDRIIGSLRHRPILTVGDMDSFARRGGLIQLVTERNRIRLRVNLSAVDSAGLTLSSNLLRQAEIIRPRED